MYISPQLPTISKIRPSTIALQGLFEYIVYLEKHREEREVKLQKELEGMKENKFSCLEDMIQKEIENKRELLENIMVVMETRLHVIKKNKILTKHPSKEMLIL